MIVSDLPKDFDITNITVKLPKEVLLSFQDYLGGEEEMYIAGPAMGEFMMSPDPPNQERRLYPMPIDVSPEDILSWEVASLTPEKENQCCRATKEEK